MRSAKVAVAWDVDRSYLVLVTPAGFTPSNVAFDRDGARALIADQLHVFRSLWPDAPMPTADHSSLLKVLK